MHLALALITSLSTPESTIQGTVRASGSLEPIPSATVAMPELRRSVATDQKGYFVLSGIPRGQWKIEASAPGYAGHGLTLVSNGTGVVRLDLELELRPIVLRPVEVTIEAGAASADLLRGAGPQPARLAGHGLKLVPGLAEADVLRALQVLPSIAAISDYSSALYVRGGSADQNLIALDGVPLFNPYHLGGIFSAIGSDAVSSVDVWPGAFPAHGGDRLSSLVNIHTRDGGRDQVRTSGAIGLISTHLTVDGPLPGRDGAFVFTGRRTYLDAVAAAAYRFGMIPDPIPYGFSDAYVKATHAVGAHGSLTLSAYADLEGMTFYEPGIDTTEFDLDWGSRMLALTYRRPIAGTLLLEGRAAYSGFSGSFNELERAPDTSRIAVRTRARDLLVGGNLTWFGSTHTLRTGLQFDGYMLGHALDTLFSGERDRFPLVDRKDRSRTIAAYVEDEWAPAEQFRLRAGLRLLDAGRLGRAWMPRVGVTWQATPSLGLSAGAGRYAQVIRTLRNDESAFSSFIAYDLLAAQPSEVGLARAEDVVVGIAWNSATSRLRAEAYTRRLGNLILPLETVDPIEGPFFIAEPHREANGSTHGLEVMLSRRFGRAQLGLSYALTRAERSAGGETFPPRFERRHLLDASATLPFGRTGVLSTRFALGSGQPYTPVLGVKQVTRYDPVTGKWWAPTHAAPIGGEHNSARLPGYLRLDLAARKGFAKRWFGQEGTLTPYVQILNLLNTRNTLIADAVVSPRFELQYWPQLPILPTFGLEWRF